MFPGLSSPSLHLRRGQQRHPMEGEPFLGEGGDSVTSMDMEGMQQQQQQQQVQLAPSWEERANQMTDDQLNFRTLSASMDKLDMEIHPPRDR